MAEVIDLVCEFLGLLRSAIAGCQKLLTSLGHLLHIGRDDRAVQFVAVGVPVESLGGAGARRFGLDLPDNVEAAPILSPTLSATPWLFAI